MCVPRHFWVLSRRQIMDDKDMTLGLAGISVDSYDLRNGYYLVHVSDVCGRDSADLLDIFARRGAVACSSCPRVATNRLRDFLANVAVSA